MSRVNLFLLLAVLASALYLVNVQYESRRLFSELDKARSQAHRIEADNERLQVERRAQATPLRIEKLAKEQLLMHSTTPAITHYVTYGTASGSAQAASAAATPGAASVVSGRVQ
jgi:cell division protein FtsL